MKENNFDFEALNNNDDIKSNENNFSNESNFYLDFSQKTIFSKTIKISSDLVYIIKIKKEDFGLFESNYVMYDYIRSPRYHANNKIKTSYMDYGTVSFLPFVIEKKLDESNLNTPKLKDNKDAIKYYSEILTKNKEIISKAFEIIKYEYQELQEYFIERENFENSLFNMHFQYINEFDENSNYLNILENNKHEKYDFLIIRIGKGRKIQLDFYEVYNNKNGYFYFIQPFFIDEFEEKYNMFEYFSPRILNILQIYKFKNFFSGYRSLKDEMEYFYTNDFYKNEFEKNIKKLQEFFEKFVIDIKKMTQISSNILFHN